MAILTIRADAPGERADQLLARSVEGLTRSAAQKLLDEGRVTAGGKQAPQEERPPGRGDVAHRGHPQPGAGGHRAPGHPAGRGVRGRGRDRRQQAQGAGRPPGPRPPGRHAGQRAAVRTAATLCAASAVKQRPGIVHRIDKDTSGLIIAAKNDFAHPALAAQLKDHSLARTYECIVCGKICGRTRGTIDAPIGRHPADRKKMAVTVKPAGSGP